jgi:hypothetical protein
MKSVRLQRSILGCSIKTLALFSDNSFRSSELHFIVVQRERHYSGCDAVDDIFMTHQLLPESLWDCQKSCPE